MARVVVLRDHEDVREVRVQSGQVLTKDQFDMRENSSHILSRVVSPAFHDPSFRPVVNLDDVVENIDCSYPLPTSASLLVLKEGNLFYSDRSNLSKTSGLLGILATKRAGRVI